MHLSFSERWVFNQTGFTSFLVSGDFCRLLISFANSLTLTLFLKDFFLEKVNFEKSKKTRIKARKKKPACKELYVLYERESSGSVVECLT